uniref:Uncharacterized protein n=1 Tax=Anguilla anguilla TaxID=7936 RepID=A0A0E9WG41_ANGAN
MSSTPPPDHSRSDTSEVLDTTCVPCRVHHSVQACSCCSYLSWASFLLGSLPLKLVLVGLSKPCNGPSPVPQLHLSLFLRC